MSVQTGGRAARVVGFVALFALLDAGLGSVLGGLAEYADPKSSPLGALEAAKANPDMDVLVLGSSRANHHIDPDLLGARLGMAVHNAGVDGQGIVFARAVQELVWANGIRPQVFVLQLQAFDVMTFEPERALVASRFLESMPATRATLEGEGYNVKVKLTSRSFRYNSLVLQLALNRLRGQPAAAQDSYVSLDGSLGESTAGPEGVPGRWTSDAREVSPESLRVLGGFVRAAVEAGSQVFVVTGPFLRGGPVLPSESAAADAIARVTSEEGGHLITVDETTHPIFDDPALFYDPSHLNRQGAALYTGILAERIAAGLDRAPAGVEGAAAEQAGGT